MLVYDNEHIITCNGPFWQHLSILNCSGVCWIPQWHAIFNQWNLSKNDDDDEQRKTTHEKEKNNLKKKKREQKLKRRASCLFGVRIVHLVTTATMSTS